MDGARRSEAGVDQSGLQQSPPRFSLVYRRNAPGPTGGLIQARVTYMTQHVQTAQSKHMQEVVGCALRSTKQKEDCKIWWSLT